jgi:avermectin B 5-O-methyltransferase
MSTQKTINYYRTFGSRVGYGVLAGGHKHFGYYGDKHYWYIPHAADAMIDHLASFAKLKPKERVLDAGCGEGRASLRLAEKFGVNVTGIDVVPEALAIAKKRAAATNAAVDYIEGDYNHLPFPDKTFDLVFALETFTHSPDPRKTLREFWRVLKPGGRVVILDY